MTTASKGASEKRKLTHYVTNTVLDSQFRGTSQQFVLHLNEQFRRLDELTDLTERMPESIVEKPLLTIGLISSCPDQFSSCALS